jgi:hypothetical protein
VWGGFNTLYVFPPQLRLTRLAGLRPLAGMTN